MELAKILIYVVCGFCALLCLIVIYLCITVRRIRRDLNMLAKNGNLVYDEAVRGDKKDDSYNRKRISSAGLRYSSEPGKNRTSAVHSDPEETITVVPRRGEEEPTRLTAESTNVASAGQENFPLQFINQGFVPATDKDGRAPSCSGSEVEHDPQPIYSNTENEQEIYMNPIDEPIYQNTGELRELNLPEDQQLHRSQTMDISDF